MPFITDSIATRNSYDAQNDFAFFANEQQTSDSIVVRQWNMVSATEIYGANTQLSTSSSSDTEQTPANSSGISWMVAGGLCLYMLIIIASKSSLFRLFSFLFFGDIKTIVPQNFKQTANMLVNFAVLVFTALLCLLLFRVMPQQNYEMSIPFQIILIAAGFYIYIYSKKILINFMGYATENKRLKWQIDILTTGIFGSLGMSILPFVMMAFLVPVHSAKNWITIIFIIIGFGIFFKFFKIFQIFIREKISPFFLILYLCALEILPIWLIVDYFARR